VTFRFSLPRPLVLAAAVGVLGAFGLAAGSAGAEVIDRVLVRVDSRAVTQSSLDQRLRQRAKEDGTPLSGKDLLEAEKAAMEDLVNEMLLDDRARQLGLTATDAEAEEQIRKLKEQNQVATEEEFAAALAASGLTVNQLREQLRRTLSVQRVVAREVYSKIDLGDDALRRAYERDRESWRLPEQVRVSEILVPRGEGNAGQARLDDLEEKLRGGEKFEALVPLYSSGGSRDRGGDLGLVSKGELNPEIEKVVFSLPAGAVSDPVATKFGWHVVKVVEKVPAGLRPFADVKGEILKREQAARYPKKLAEYLGRLKREAVIQVSAEASAYYAAPAPEAPVEMKPTTKAPGQKP
jgi:parvulin-like peptidyl-prolyl isomerase